MAISTNCQPSSCGTVNRKQPDGTSVEEPCPESIISYNKFMGGVDRGDQLHGYYRCRSKSRKFYKYIFSFSLMWQSPMLTSCSRLQALAPSRTSSRSDCNSQRIELIGGNPPPSEGAFMESSFWEFWEVSGNNFLGKALFLFLSSSTGSSMHGLVYWLGMVLLVRRGYMGFQDAGYNNCGLLHSCGKMSTIEPQIYFFAFWQLKRNNSISLHPSTSSKFNFISKGSSRIWMDRILFVLSFVISA